MAKLLAVIMPVYNEESTVLLTVGRVLEQPAVRELTVVDDGSTDHTADALQSLTGTSRVVVLSHARNRGKGAAIRTALAAVSSPYTIVQDADAEYDPDDYQRIVDELDGYPRTVVYGSRFRAAESRGKSRGRAADKAVWVLTTVANWLYNCSLTDVATCYKAFPTELLRRMDLQSEGFEFCGEVTAKTCRLGYRIREIPIRYAPRSRKEGKKIRWWHGVPMLAALWKYRHWEPTTIASRAVRP
jgi:glycosyltransferase involved in cell wall biosynthesis